MTERQYVRIEYRIRPDADLTEVERAIKTFVAGIRDHDAGSLYTSYRDAKDARHFIHVGSFARGPAEDLQTQAFFKTFTAALRGWTVAPADVAMLEPVATAR